MERRGQLDDDAVAAEGAGDPCAGTRRLQPVTERTTGTIERDDDLIGRRPVGGGGCDVDDGRRAGRDRDHGRDAEPGEQSEAAEQTRTLHR